MLNINKAEELNTYNPKGYKTHIVSFNNGSDNSPTIVSVTYRNSYQDLDNGQWCNAKTFIKSLAKKLNVSESSIKLVK